MLNGISVAALSEFGHEVAQQPQQGLARYQVGLKWLTGVRAQVNTRPMSLGERKIGRDFSWTVDEPRPLLGHDHGASPQEYLLTGFGACLLVAFLVAATTRGVAVEDIDIQVEGDLDLAGFLDSREGAPVALTALRYQLMVKAQTTDTVLQELHQQALRRSPNAQTLKKAVDLQGVCRLK